MAASPRLVIIGLDCAEPSLVFERWHDDLPNLARLMQQGSYGTLESCIPAITVPAWSCMMSGRDPGELGIYGFRNRVDRSYKRMGVADGRAIHVPRLWDILSDVGWKVAVIGVPGTYPPRPVNGALVSCFLTPSTSSTYTYPEELAHQISVWVGDYLLDVPNFRSEDKERILRDIYMMCDQRFGVAHHVLRQYEPDMLMLVEMGVDRIHHALWKQMDPRHPLHVANSPLSEAIHDYYRHVDRRIGELLERCTKAWGSGGYYGRIFMNVRGREPEGTIPVVEYERERTALAERLRAMLGPDGQPSGNRVFTPQQLYHSVRGVAPDLIVYFSDLAWRAVGTVGSGELYTTENDTGPDDANHAQYGMMIAYDPQHPGNGQQLEGAQIYDVLPTLLARYGLKGPAGLRGKILQIA